jgi:FkbM family methyltransferase
MNFRSHARAFYKGVIFKMSAGNSKLFHLFYRYLYKPQKGSIDEFASNYSGRRRSITVVEVGANDGINNDPLHKFIRRDNWKGVLLEPQKFVFEKYLKPLYATTDGITVLNAALDFTDGIRPLYKIAVSGSRWATGLASFSREVVEEAVSSGYVEKQAMKEGTSLPIDKADFIATELVECISVVTLLKRYDLKKVDWLQIDTEGFDFEIIKMFISEKIRPEVIVYENIHFTDDQQKECLNFLTSLDYLCRTFGPNTLAMKKPANGYERYFT